MVPSLTGKAIESLRRCCLTSGLKASGRADGHTQVWARDSMIALLGARFAGDPQIEASLHASIALLRSRQTQAGAIPNNVDTVSLRPNFRAYVDGGLWWIVGSSLMAPDDTAAQSALRWYECQDVDQCGLVAMQESSDWEDLFCTRGKGLYVNCLYVMALRAAGRSDEAERVKAAINRYFWYEGDGRMMRHIAHSFSTESPQEYDSLGRRRYVPEKKKLRTEKYYLSYLGFREVGEWFDSLGNLLAILSGVADEQQTALIFDLIERHHVATRPMRAITPVVMPGDSDWRDYYGTLNAPHSYHNGGVWPFIGGFYVAALVAAGRMQEAKMALQQLGALNLAGDFNEWHHGESLAPMGVRDQAWSAGMYLFAHRCVEEGLVPLTSQDGNIIGGRTSGRS